MSDDLRISFYGDDFTGSTDAMESLARSGLRTILFTKPPTLEQLARHPDLQAFGVAGMTRSMSPAEKEKVLRPAFASLKESGAPIVHYKVCSTFDSSPTIGSIGRVIDVGAQVFETQCVPLLVGAPSLGRHCVFGNLFARYGGEGDTYRLDRHPSVSKHPITPMEEGDLRIHLARQTRKQIGLFNVLDLERDAAEADRVYDAQVAAGAQVLLIDLLYESQLARVGRLIARQQQPHRPLFVVGSSGVESALSAHWRTPAQAFNPPGDAGPIIAVCGSCSPVTGHQIVDAVDRGFVVVADLNNAVAPAIAALRGGKSIVIHSQRVELPDQASIGPTLGRILREVLGETGTRRVIVAGGDTSGAVAHALGIESMEMIAELTRGSPLVRVTAPSSPANGIEMTFKGGQIGKQDFFSMVLNGAK